MNINSVLGGGIKNPEDARTINTRARELGFSTSIGIIHDGAGRLKPLGPVERRVFDDVSAAISGPWQILKNLYSGITNFQNNLADGQPNDWRCRAGARYLYVCENGLVHYCSQQRGFPAVPLESYTDRRYPPRLRDAENMRALLYRGCVHRVSTMDFWRSPAGCAARPGIVGREPVRCYGARSLRPDPRPGLLLFALPRFLGVLPPCLGTGPVFLEEVHHLANHARLADQDTDLAARFELQFSKALAADERPLPIADDRAT